MPNDEQTGSIAPRDAVLLVHGTIRACRTGGEEWLSLHLWRNAQFDRERVAHACPRRIALLCPAYEERPLTGRL